MNQSVLLNNDLKFDQESACWLLTGFYQSQTIKIYLSAKKLHADTKINDTIIFDIEADIEEWLASNEPDDSNEIWL